MFLYSVISNAKDRRAHNMSIVKFGCFVKQISTALIGGLKPTLHQLFSLCSPSTALRTASVPSVADYSHSIVAGGLLEMS